MNHDDQVGQELQDANYQGCDGKGTAAFLPSTDLSQGHRSEENGQNRERYVGDAALSGPAALCSLDI